LASKACTASNWCLYNKIWVADGLGQKKYFLNYPQKLQGIFAGRSRTAVYQSMGQEVR
jgi:hypothetical protein